MEKTFVSAAVVSTIVLCVVGIVKLPFSKFKETHANAYKIIFTCVSFILAVVLSIIDELFILCGELLTFDFAVLVCVVLSSVFFGYNGVYEGLGLKELVKKLVGKIKEARDLAQNKKFVEYLKKIDDIDNAIRTLEEIKILEERKRNDKNGNT